MKSSVIYSLFFIFLVSSSLHVKGINVIISSVSEYRTQLLLSDTTLVYSTNNTNKEIIISSFGNQSNPILPNTQLSIGQPNQQGYYSLQNASTIFQRMNSYDKLYMIFSPRNESLIIQELNVKKENFSANITNTKYVVKIQYSNIFQEEGNSSLYSTLKIEVTNDNGIILASNKTTIPSDSQTEWKYLNVELDECAFASDNTSCDDGIYCNGIDICTNNKCEHSGDPCIGNAICSQVCNEEIQNCMNPIGDLCDDGSSCTLNDTCNGQGECLGETNLCASYCPVSEPIRCDDSCHSSIASCFSSCEKRCFNSSCTDSFHSSCEDDLSLLLCPYDRYRCPDGTCTNNNMDCHCEPTVYRCYDETCVLNPQECVQPPTNIIPFEYSISYDLVSKLIIPLIDVGQIETSYEPFGYIEIDRSVVARRKGVAMIEFSIKRAIDIPFHNPNFTLVSPAVTFEVSSNIPDPFAHPANVSLPFFLPASKMSIIDFMCLGVVRDNEWFCEDCTLDRNGNMATGGTVRAGTFGLLIPKQSSEAPVPSSANIVTYWPLLTILCFLILFFNKWK